MLIDELKGKTITQIEGMLRGSSCVQLTTSDGARYRMWADTYSRGQVQLEDVCGDILDLVETPICVAEARTMRGPSHHSSSTWTFYELATMRGSVTLRWLGTSNGYYSESVNFEELDAHAQAGDGLLEDGVHEVETEHGREWWMWDGESWRDYHGAQLDASQARRRFTVWGPVLRRPDVTQQMT